MSDTSLFRALPVRLPAVLAKPRALSKINAIVRGLPDIGETFGFEVRLADGDDAVDVGLAFGRESRSQRRLAAANLDADIADVSNADRSWARLCQFARSWVGSPALQARVPFVFLEFDSEGPDRPVPVPSVFFGLDWQIEELSPDRSDIDKLARELPKDLRRLVEIVRPERIDAHADTALVSCFRALPAGGVVIHVGTMLSRTGAAVRLSVCVPSCDALQYLALLGRDGIEHVDEILETYAATADFAQGGLVQIDFDLLDRSAIGIGLQPGGSANWTSLLEALVATDLCCPRKRDALLAWPGQVGWVQKECLVPVPWLIDSYLSHFKIVMRSGVRPSAKAYLGMTPRPLFPLPQFSRG